VPPPTVPRRAGRRRLLETFSHGAKNEVSLDALTAELLEVVNSTMHPARFVVAETPP
jgi:hypothetical protein